MKETVLKNLMKETVQMKLDEKLAGKPQLASISLRLFWLCTCVRTCTQNLVPKDKMEPTSILRSETTAKDVKW